MGGLMDDLDKRTDLIQQEIKEKMAKEKAKEQEKKRKATEQKQNHDIL
jgi:hypothetical protein